jgi:hypothetical protein
VGVTQEPCSLGPISKRNGAADAVIDVFAGNWEIVQIYETAQEVELTLDGRALGLIFGRDAGVNGDGLRCLRCAFIGRRSPLRGAVTMRNSLRCARCSHHRARSAA